MATPHPAASPFPPERIESVCETTAPDNPSSTKTQSVAPASAALPTTTTEPTGLPRPRRTLFAVALQIARSFGPLCVLVLAGIANDRKTIVAQALMIADAILFGARDRSRDKFRRSLFDQQQRSDSLHQPRPTRPRPTKAAASKRKRRS